MDAEETSGEGRVMLGPLLLIVIGVLFLLNNMYPGVFRFGRMWPVILIVIGLAKVIEYIQGQSAGNKKEGE
jgi:hypothetical protein